MSDSASKDLNRAFLWLAAGTLALFLALIVAFTVGYRQNRLRVSDLRREIHARCAATEQIKSILHTEHTRKLRSTASFLRHHPHGIDGISRVDILISLEIERAIVRQTKAIRCP